MKNPYARPLDSGMKCYVPVTLDPLFRVSTLIGLASSHMSISPCVLGRDRF